MTGTRPVRLPSGDLSLEGAVHRHRLATPHAIAVVCHPHPGHGGCMDHPVVVSLAESLAAAGIVTLRFNFRGVGRSQGRHGGGALEADDLAAAMDYATQLSDASLPLVLAGYSFGAWVAYPVGCADPRVGVVLCVAPPLELLPMPQVPQSAVARWFGLGDRDGFCELESFRTWYRTQEDPKEHLVLAGADHFLAGREAELGAAAAAFALSHVGRSQP